MDGRQTPARCRGFEDTLDLARTLSGPFDYPLHRGQTRRTGQMARITLRQLLDHAAERDYGVPAFNINNMEQGLAVMEAADQVDAPVILQASRGARTYAGDIMLARMMEALEAMFPHIPLCVHQDHGNSEA